MASCRRRNEQIVRTLRVIRELRRRRQTAMELAAALGVHKRTIYRDLEALQASEVPLRNTSDAHGTGYNGFWWIARDWSL